MFTSLSRRPGYRQITKIPRFDFLTQVHVLLTCHVAFDVTNIIYHLQTRFLQSGSKNDKPPSGRPPITPPLEVRVIVTSS